MKSSVSMSDLKLVVTWAKACAKILNKHQLESYKKPLRIFHKEKLGITTNADLAAEDFLIKKISKKFPTHQIIAEEEAYRSGSKISQNTSDFVWLIDPLDGTNNFYNKLPFYSISIALCYRGSPVLGVVLNPMTGELFYAAKNRGAFLEKKIGEKKIKLKLSPKKEVKFSEAILSANFGHKLLTKRFKDELPPVRTVRRLGSAALELSYVAAGMLDAYWEHTLQPWDVAAAGIICEEAGVKISGIHENEFSPFSPSVLAAHPALYTRLKSLLNTR